MPRAIDASLLNTELDFTASRSDGPGGQNVNKVNSKITLRFDIRNSTILTPEEKTQLLQKLRSRVTNEGVLILSSQESRSQLANKEIVVAKFDEWIRKALEPVKARKKTKPSKSSAEARIKSKKLRSEKKKWRQKP